MDLISLAKAHIEAENNHSLDQTMATIGPDGAYYKVYANNETFTSRNDIRTFYDATMKGLPDMNVEIEHMIQDEESRHVFLQYKFTGTHLGDFSGLPPTGKRLTYQGAILYQFDENGKLIKEVNYFDKTEILSSIGLIRDTNTKLGQFLLMFPQSPFYTLKAAIKSLFRKKQ
ncbi:MAG TPA: ester cyclase [Candidatus Kapabacteria bacterium]|nr:ester cyclase [Candidatus Kapabacteria bacterium]